VLHANDRNLNKVDVEATSIQAAAEIAEIEG
jgi:hypothetical protein